MRHLLKVGNNPGVPTPKRAEAIVVAVDDVQTWPTLNVDGVTWDGNFIFKPGASFTKVYMTPSTQKATLSSEGNPDAYGAKGKFEGEYPGTPKEAIAWIRKNASRGFVIFYGGCDNEESKTMGTKCVPMILKPAMEDGNDKNIITLTFEQEMVNDQYVRFYAGSVETDGGVTTLSTPAVVLNADRFQLPVATDGATVTFTAGSVNSGVITLVGGGGSSPVVVKNSAGTADPQVILANGATWTGLSGAVLNLRIVKSDKTYLIEVSRN